MQVVCLSSAGTLAIEGVVAASVDEFDSSSSSLASLFDLARFVEGLEFIPEMIGLGVSSQ